jgi:hypothetical protein
LLSVKFFFFIIEQFKITKLSKTSLSDFSGRLHTLHRKKLYRQFSFIGSNRKNGKDRNYFSYVYFAAKVMDSPHMKNQLSKAWNILHAEIRKYEVRFRLPSLNRVNTKKKAKSL